MINLSNFFNSDLGINCNYLYEICSRYQNSIFVDLGVRFGVSSEIMLLNSEEKNNKVFGVDVDWNYLYPQVRNNKKYTMISGDSCSVGKQWKSKIQGLFIDTFHIKEQVLTELYYWYDHLAPDGFIAFHDTNWPEGKHDTFGNITWDRVEDAVKLFFTTSSLNYEDEFIKMTNYPDSWGMTIVEIKKKKDYISKIKNWDEIFEKRNKLISLFWDENNKKDLILELNLTPQN